MLNAIAELLRDLIDWIIVGVSTVAQVLLDQLVGALGFLFEACGFPGLTTIDLGPFAEFLSWVNQWLPLQEALCLLIVGWGFQTTFTTVKMVLKVTPWIG
ncbi:MAG: hypothetical protein AAF726_17930 [Planctomycetota bacterium]